MCEQTPAVDSRWKCPSCGSKNVQVSLPTWYKETSAGELIFVNTDEEASVQFWYCADCKSTGEDEPLRA